MSSRAHGRKGTQRPVTVATPEEIATYGLPDQKPLDAGSGTGNITNYQTVRQRPAGPDVDLPEFRGPMAHGVIPDADTAWERAQHMRGEGPRGKDPAGLKEIPQITPVPVFIVEQAGGGTVIRSASPRHLTVPNTASEPTRLCGRNPRRVRVGILNEDTATNIRFAQRISDLTAGGGALLPYVVNNYSWFETQDELYALSTSATLNVLVSIVEEFEKKA